MAPGSQNLRISSSRLPSMHPTITGTIQPIRIDMGILVTPAAPRATMVKKGPSLMERMDTAPTSVASPYSPARAAYSPPLELARAPTMARVESPKNPFSPKRVPQISPIIMPIPTFTAVMTTPLYIVTPAFLKFMVVALQKIKTARMGMAPDFHRYVVKVPSNALHKTFPKKVLTIAPRSSGTTIKPPGIFLTACKIFILNVPPVRLL